MPTDHVYKTHAERDKPANDLAHWAREGQPITVCGLGIVGDGFAGWVERARITDNPNCLNCRRNMGLEPRPKRPC